MTRREISVMEGGSAKTLSFEGKEKLRDGPRAAKNHHIDGQAAATGNTATTTATAAALADSTPAADSLPTSHLHTPPYLPQALLLLFFSALGPLSSSSSSPLSLSPDASSLPAFPLPDLVRLPPVILLCSAAFSRGSPLPAF